ncbi:MAG: putative secreted protein, SAP11-like [Candidatus Phytoplasma pruni]|uniref:SVM family protein n=1 Tax=Poinsettia branch-inducing phytoplasma TaxID=138647 RepID=UPI00036690DE|nr:SVM family protein [Poinsettia branch-inducing phytoplasma]WEK82326.1 MAG: putative secreted protein, SAP11-like [Candidatus Phytoplasma pruni]
MFKVKNQFKVISIYLFVFISLLFIFNNNQVMAAPKKEHGKGIASSKEPEETTKQDIKNYFELYNVLEKCSDEDRNKIIEMLQDPEFTQLLQKKPKRKQKK